MLLLYQQAVNNNKNKQTNNNNSRVYYMAARRYEISLRVRAPNERNIYLKYINEIPNHFTIILFAAKAVIFHVPIATVIFSRVRTSCFLRESSPCISLMSLFRGHKIKPANFPKILITFSRGL